MSVENARSRCCGTPYRRELDKEFASAAFTANSPPDDRNYELKDVPRNLGRLERKAQF